MRSVLLGLGLMLWWSVVACISPTYRNTEKLQNQNLTQTHQRNQRSHQRTRHTKSSPRKLLAAANNLKGKSEYWVSGQRYRGDCSGFVQAALLKAGFDLQAYLPEARDREGTVKRLYRMASKHRMLHRKRRPKPGDLVFFDNTWDRNENGRLDDPLTHVGIVISSDADGTITYIHKVRQGVKLYKMNRVRHQNRDPKSKKVLNSFLRRRGYAGERLRLSGQLFRAYATVFGKRPILTNAYASKRR